MKFFIISALILLFLLTIAFGIGYAFVRMTLMPSGKLGQREAIKTKESDENILARIRAERKKQNEIGRQFEFTMQTVKTFGGDDIILHGMLRKRQEKSHKWVIGIHGFKDTYRYMLSYGAVYYKKGYNVLLPDCRAHGKSGGKYIGMGWLDRQDILQWILWITSQDKDAEIILHGVSMGAAAAMFTACKQPDHVIACIEDCGFSSVWDIFLREACRRFGLIGYPIVFLADKVCGILAGYRFKEASLIKELENCKIPICFIHGLNDAFVPVEMCQRLYEVTSSQKTILQMPHAGHCQARDVSPDQYWRTIFWFIDLVEKKVIHKEDL